MSAKIEVDNMSVSASGRNHNCMPSWNHSLNTANRIVVMVCNAVDTVAFDLVQALPSAVDRVTRMPVHA